MMGGFGPFAPAGQEPQQGGGVRSLGSMHRDLALLLQAAAVAPSPSSPRSDPGSPGPSTFVPALPLRPAANMSGIQLRWSMVLETVDKAISLLRAQSTEVAALQTLLAAVSHEVCTSTRCPRMRGHLMVQGARPPSPCLP